MLRNPCHVDFFRLCKQCLHVDILLARILHGETVNIIRSISLAQLASKNGVTVFEFTFLLTYLCSEWYALYFKQFSSEMNRSKHVINSCTSVQNTYVFNVSFCDFVSFCIYGNIFVPTQQ